MTSLLHLMLVQAAVVILDPWEKDSNAYRQSLPPEERRLHDRRLHQSSLLPPLALPWLSVYRSQLDADFITMTSLNYDAFHYLLAKLELQSTYCFIVS